MAEGFFRSYVDNVDKYKKRIGLMASLADGIFDESAVNFVGKDGFCLVGWRG